MNALSVRILAGLVVGLAAGAALEALWPQAARQAVAAARPIGALWLNGLTMTVTPLVFGLVVIGVSGRPGPEGDEARGDGAAARRAFAWFAALLVAACAVSVIFCTLALKLWPVAASMPAPPGAGAIPKIAAPGDWLAGFVPTNPIKAAAETAVAPLVVFALLFGFAMRRIAEPLRRALAAVIQGIVETMLVIVRWVLWLGPLGVGALALTVGAQLGAGAVSALIHYILLVASACLAITVLAYPAAVVFGRISPRRFARACLSPQAVAISTQSSLASMPAMVEAAPALGVREETAGVVLPLAVSVFRAASAAANVAVTLYLAHVHGVALSPGALALLVFVAAVVSLAAVGLPAQVSFFATIAPLCLAVGVPVTLLPLLLAVESVPDLFRTLGNVTCDLAVTRIVGRGEEGDRP